MTADDHGSVSTYSNHKCRCDSCRAAHRDSQRAARRRRTALLAADPSMRSHGLVNTYKEWGCRCRPCTDAWAAHQRAKKRRAAA